MSVSFRKLLLLTWNRGNCTRTNLQKHATRTLGTALQFYFKMAWLWPRASSLALLSGAPFLAVAVTCGAVTDTVTTLHAFAVLWMYVGVCYSISKNSNSSFTNIFQMKVDWRLGCSVDCVRPEAKPLLAGAAPNLSWTRVQDRPLYVPGGWMRTQKSNAKKALLQYQSTLESQASWTWFIFDTALKKTRTKPSTIPFFSVHSAKYEYQSSLWL